MRRRAALLLLPFAASACSRDSARPTGTSEPVPAVSTGALPDPFLPTASAAPSTSAAPETATPTPNSSVTLEDPGREPRRELRYAWRPDQKEQMAITLRTTVSADSGGAHQDVPFPALHIVVAIDPRGISPAGDLTYAWRVTSAETDADASAPAQVAQGWAAQLVPIAHLSGTGGITSRGLSTGVALDAPPGPDAGGQEMVDQVRQMLRDACAPMPVEPVGKGAKWQKVSTLDAKNGHATQTDTYTLADLQGDKGAVDDTLAQTASPQPLPTPVGAGPSMTARVDSLLTSGTAKIHFDLSRVVAGFQFDGTTAMALTAPTNRMNMVMRLGIDVQGSTR